MAAIIVLFQILLDSLYYGRTSLDLQVSRSGCITSLVEEYSHRGTT